MVSSESEEDARNMDRRWRRQQQQPLCMFYGDPGEDRTYVGESERKEAAPPHRERKCAARRKGKEDLWLRRRREVNMKRRRQEAGRHLKNYLFMSGRPDDSEDQEEYVPRLVNALQVLKDAWPPKKRTFDERNFDEDSPTPRRPEPMPRTGTREPTFLGRRSSVPEEVIRRYCLKKTVASEESETNLTEVPDASSASTKRGDEAKKDEAPRSEAAAVKPNGGREDKAKRVMQSEYDKHGRGIIKQKTRERSSQTGRSETTPSAEEEDTEESRTTESLPSSSPVELPRQVVEEASTSGNLSSESDEVRCTCAELSSSKDTSTDAFRSGNSTLSQTVSEKSTSTQDSTASVHSVSTGGSTLSPESNSTSPDTYARASAKDASSPDFAPRTVKWTTRRFVRGRGRVGARCPKLRRKRLWKRHSGSSNGVFEDILEDKEPKGNDAEEERNVKPEPEKADVKYTWSACTPEETYMMQQMRHRKFVENDRSFSVPVPATPDTGSLGVCPASTYKDHDELSERLLIPRYSALPRTMSMLVNTSSGNTSVHNSDSELSLSDSLEEFPITHVHRLQSYDTKKESKPVRGDVTAHQDAKKRSRHRHRVSHAFFISMKDPYGEDDLLSGIEKIPEPPKKIRDRINERQLRLFTLQRRNLEKRREAREGAAKDGSRKRREHKEGRVPRAGKEPEAARTARQGANESTSKTPERELPCCRKKKSRKEWETRAGNKPEERPQGNEATGAPKPQAVIHPSQQPPPPTEADVPKRTKQHAGNPGRAMRFRQRFEVIPEEKSSSLSSTEENRASEKKGVAPRGDNPRKYSLGNVTDVVLAKFAGKSMPCPHKRSGKEQQPPIIVVENPKEGNSAKGRDALIAMNREDFNRLSKGWMNFYVLKETPEYGERDERKADEREKNAKDHEEVIKEEGDGENPQAGNPQRERQEPDNPLRFYSSNTILTPITGVAREKESKKLSLPELKLNTSGSASEQQNPKSPTIFLPKVSNKNSDNDGMDSDSTVYCQPPSSIVPRLDFHGSGDFPSEDTASSENEDADNVPAKQLPLGRRGNARRLRQRREEGSGLRAGSQGRSEWSVTVAGTLELTSAAPDLEMRLSFPADAPVQASQSDSGFTEDVSAQNADASTRTDRGAFSNRNAKQRWMVTVKNPAQGGSAVVKQKPHGRPHLLPDLGKQSQSRNVKKVLKESSAAGNNGKDRCRGREISLHWPGVGLATGERADDDDDDDDDDDAEVLSVRGNAVSLRKKPRAPTMTERDLGRMRQTF